MPSLSLLVALLAPQAAAATPLEGTWSVEMRVVTEARIPLLGRLESSTTTLMLAEVHASTEGLVQEHRTCAIRVQDPTRVARTTIPDAFVEAMPRKHYPLRLDDGAEELRVRADLGPLLVGWDGPPDASLPERADDPAIRDFDGDGLPGATVEVQVRLLGSARMFMVQRSHAILDGTLQGDAIRGQVHVRALEQHTIGASRRAFDFTPDLRPVPGASTFEMRRLPPGAGCDEVVAAWESGRAVADAAP